MGLFLSIILSLLIKCDLVGLREIQVSIEGEKQKQQSDIPSLGT